MNADAGPFDARIVLVEPRNPLNIGAAARAMSNFGFTELRLVKPYDLAYREARSAVRSRYILETARVFDSVSDAVGDCALVIGTTSAGHRDLHLPLYRLEAAARLIQERGPSSPSALLFGSEKFGLSNEHLSFCHWLLRIPTRDEHGSMNLGQAVAVCLYELRRDAGRERDQYTRPDTLGSADEERVTELLLDLLASSGYIQERTAGSTELKIRRLVRRLGIPNSDAETWLGILRQIRWKLKRDQKEPPA